MGLLSEDRKSEGLALGLSVADNLTLTRLEPFGAARLVLPARQQDGRSAWIARMAIKCGGPSQPAASCRAATSRSGDRAAAAPRRGRLILDEPTRGIDVGSKAQIYRLIDELVADTRRPAAEAVLMVSSYLPELLGLCDRIAVMQRGRLAAAAPRRRPDRARADDAGHRGGRGMTARSLLDRTGTLLGLLLVAAIFGVLVGGQFFAPANLELMARQTAIVCMAALGMTIVIATGGIDLSVGSIDRADDGRDRAALRADLAPLTAAAAAWPRRRPAAA
jgi:hypothetical protein